MSSQSGWRWCQKCQGMFFSGNPDQGNCPSGGKHDGSPSARYVMLFGEGGDNTQPQGGWRWCQKCEGMFWSGLAFFPGDDLGRKMCPGGGAGTVGGNHHQGGFGAPNNSAHYVMEFGQGGSDAQGGWRWCKNCFGLFFSGNPDQGNCPSGGKHDGSRSGPYQMHFELAAPDLPQSVTLHSGPITTDLSIGGSAALFMDRGGNFTFTGHMHDSGALGIDFLITVVAMTPSGIAITAQQSGHCAGTFTTGSRDADWTVPGVNNQLRDNWAEASQATLTWTAHANDTLTPEVAAALEEALKQALLAAGKAAVQALISLV